MLDYDLSKSELLILAFINSFSKIEFHERYLTVNGMSYKLNLDQSTCKRALNKLKNLHLINSFKIDKKIFYLPSINSTFNFDEE